MARSWFTARSPLPIDEYDRRHRGLVALLCAHLIALPVFGVLMGWSLGASLLVCAPAAAFVVPATIPTLGRTARASCCVIGLLCCSAALVWLWHGTTEAHFHYFVIVGAVGLYEATLPFAIAFAFVVIQHGLMSLWMPARVFGNMAAMHHPWLWAGIHGGFVAALAIATLASWRANDRARLREDEAVQSALASERRLRRAFAGAPNGAALIGEDGTIEEANEALARSMRTRPESLVGQVWPSLIAADEDADPVRWPPTSPGLDRERRVVRGDDSEGWLLVTYSALGDEHDPEWIVQTLDITRRREAERRLAFQASHDPLTGLLNRHTFAERAQRALDDTGAYGVCVLFVDVDDFKLVNDSLGHDAGDDLLVAVADRLRSVLRADDLIGRFGGDEFVVCLSEPSPDAADATAQRVADAFATPFGLVGVEREVTASVGLALAMSGERSIDSLLRDADLAMYESKTGGKARYTWFDTAMRERAIEQLELESALRRAVIEHEIDVHYQPQVASDGRVVGLEALARWRHPTRGMISPGVFIPIAEQSGLVAEIGAQVMRRACRQARVWAAADPRLGELTISVNASPRCLIEGDLPRTIAEILTATGVPAHRVCIEVTETAAISRTAETTSTISALKALGVRLAMDDFGVGQSSLAQLSRLGPLDELKIDKALIDGIASSTTASRVIGAVIDVAVADGLNVVAEGVEQTEQMIVLHALGCPMIQGYLYSPPVPADAVPALIGRIEAGERAEFASAG